MFVAINRCIPVENALGLSAVSCLVRVSANFIFIVVCHIRTVLKFDFRRVVN